MKKNYLWMLGAILTCGLLTMACSVIENPVEREMTKNIDLFWDMPGNEGDSTVVAALESIENVQDLKPFINKNLGQAYYFNYNQLIDHSDPSKGTFKQQVVLTFVGEDANTILHTEGYSLLGYITENNNTNRLDTIEAPDLLWQLSKNGGKDQKFDLNCVQVEYRYHGFSLPEGDNNRFTYLNAWQHSQDLHAIVTDLKEALITGNGKWLSTGVSKNGEATAHYAYYDEMYDWNDIDLYVPFVAPILQQQYDLRVGTYMLTKSSKDMLPTLEKVYKKLVDDQAILDATITAYSKIYEAEVGKKLSADSAVIKTLERTMWGLFKVQSYGDYATWTKLIPTEKSTPEEYAAFFMLSDKDTSIYRKTQKARGPLAWREDPFEMQTKIDIGDIAFDFTWFLDGKLLSDSDKKYLKDNMEANKKSNPMEMHVSLLKNLETTTKNMIFIYGEDDPWTGAAIPDPTNPNVKKYIIPHGSHTDEFDQYAWYPGGAEIAKQILDEIKAIMNPE
jgi:hypothetical protein